MEILFYNDFEYHHLKEKISKTIGFLQVGDFRSADVKKMPNVGYYRARLDDTNRLLFSIGSYQGKKYLFILETILQHRYDRCRFLNGLKIEEEKLSSISHEQELECDELPMSYVNAGKKTFHLLDKILSFDDAQAGIISLPAPLIVIGPAGSGKTALMLEKLKTLPGSILYTSLSAFLVENAQNLYASFGYDNPRQEVDFLSFKDYLSTFQVAEGRELNFRAFNEWVSHYKQSYKIKDANKLFEEFKGVLTGSVTDRAFLSADDYEQLGIRQSIFPQQEREVVYQLFTKYLKWLQESGYYDSNLLSFQLLHKITPRYDYVVVDEVQDITNVQLSAILKSLKKGGNFMLCGDSNQIVHPNFFSWSQVKSLFYHQDLSANIIRVLATNYRNTPEVTDIANRLLLIKNARFGSIDKESTYLVQANSINQGIVEFLPNLPKVRADLNQKTSRSAKFAVLVLREEDKAEARKYFQTPLLFSIQEAKGLEYDSIILYNIVSGYDKTFLELTNGVSEADLRPEDIHFSRAKDKADRSLDAYKFYVNALYVGMTRAIRNLFLLESNPRHELLQLLGLTQVSEQTSLKDQRSSQKEWQEEARRLELQGKQEQADAIREQILHVKPVEWEVITRENLPLLKKEALDSSRFNKKAKDRLFQYAVLYHINDVLNYLSALKYRPAEREETAEALRKIYIHYKTDHLPGLLPQFQKYGINFRNELNFTPLMLAVKCKASHIMDYLLANGVQLKHVSNDGNHALHYLLELLIDNSGADVRHFVNAYFPALKLIPLRIRIGNQLIKLENHQGEFMLLNFMLASLYHFLMEGSKFPDFYSEMPKPAYQTHDFVNAYTGLNEQVIPEYRTKRTYISSLLAKNEVNGKDPYNKKLFIRVKLGFYLPHPGMELQIGDQWFNVYDLANYQVIEPMLEMRNKSSVRMVRLYREDLARDPDAIFDADRYRKGLI